jgi:hypothetical protein
MSLNKDYTRIEGTDAINTIDSTNDTQLTEVEADMTTIESHLNDVTTNPHAVTKTQVGLGSCENTADADKPVSTATQTALNLKANLASPTLVTPVLGVATATSVNKVAITAPATSATLTIADTKTLTVSNDATVSGTNTGDDDDETITITDNTTNDVSASAHGWCPKLPGGTGTFLRSDGQYAVPATGGGNVNGPASSVDENIALFDGTSGTLIKDSGVALPSGDIVTEDGTQTLTNKTLTTPVISVWDGWNLVSDSWTYAATDAPTFTITVPAGAGSLYSAGMKLKLTQTTVKYFIITKVSDTILTIYGGTDYTLVNAAISAIYVSSMSSPLNFPKDPTKWTVEVTDTTNRGQASAAQNTWYNMGSVLITIPIGAWNTHYEVLFGHSTTGNFSIFTTLSTANNSESDADLTLCSAWPSIYQSIPGYRSKTLVLATKTAYYLNTRTTTAGTPTLDNNNAVNKCIIRAICGYLN